MQDEKIVRKNQRIAKLRDRLRRSEQELDSLRKKLAGTDMSEAGFEGEKVVWIFGTGRSGSTWLSSMTGEFGAVWNEPLVGALFGEFYYERAAHKRGKPAILGDPHRGLWISQIRRVVLEGAAARYPDLAGFLTIKEPHGTTGAPLLSEAVPESRLVCLVRDPRDVTASALDARKEGGWVSKNKRWEGKRAPQLSDMDPVRFATVRARTYLRDVTKAKEAYESHRGPKTLVRYEDLRADTLGEMRRLQATLSMAAHEGDLTRAVEKHSWERIPQHKKGEGKFYRKGTPGSWREDLTDEQVEVVERITAPLLEEFYPH